jgi:hypothetical protein
VQYFVTPVRQSLHKEIVFLLLLFFIKRKEAGLGTASRRKNNYWNYGLLHVFHAQAKIEACGYYTKNLKPKTLILLLAVKLHKCKILRRFDFGFFAE